MARAKPEDLWNGPDTFKKKVALYGGGYTRALINDHPLVDDDCEIWSGNHIWSKWGDDCPRLDRCFDIHEIELLKNYSGEDDKTHFEWLQKEHPFPIYMQNPDDRFPSALNYPYDEVCHELFGRVYRGAERKAAFGSTIDFMAALAAYEEYDWVGYFGIEMTSSTEYQYQIPDAHWHMGFMAGRKITTWVPDDPRCSLLRRQVYGYEGFQMISRQTLEKMYYEYERQRRDWVTAANTWIGAYRLATGQLEEARNNGHSSEELAAFEKEAVILGEKVRRARETAAVASGMMIATKHSIEIADLQEPDFELHSTIFDDIPLEEIKP